MSNYRISDEKINESIALIKQILEGRRQRARIYWVDVFEYMVQAALEKLNGSLQVTPVVSKSKTEITAPTIAPTVKEVEQPRALEPTPVLPKQSVVEQIKKPLDKPAASGVSLPTTLTWD